MSTLSMPPAPPPPPELGWSPDPPILAGGRSQAAVLAVCSLAIVILVGRVDGGSVAALAVVALGIGAGLGVATPAGLWFTRVSGALAAGGVMFVSMMLLLLFSGGEWDGMVPVGAIVLLGLLVLGLDWRFASRLRPLVVISGFLVVVAAADGDRWTHLGALVWLAVAFWAFTSLEADRRASLPVATPMDPTRGERAGGGGDLATIIATALAVAIVAAMVLGVPSCRRLIDPPTPDGLGQFGELDGTNGNGSGSSGPSPAGTGSSGSSGSSGIGGGVAVEEGSGEGGTAVPHRYVPDPDGAFLIPDPDTSEQPEVDPSERIPSPGSMPYLPPGEESTSVIVDGGRVTYEPQPDGTTIVRVEDGDGDVAVYRFTPESEGMTQIDVLGADGETIRTYHYDPNGVMVDDAADRLGPASGTAPADQPDDAEDGSPTNLWPLLVGLLVLAVVVAGLAWWWSRRTPKGLEQAAPPWALALVDQLEAAGRARQCPRRAAETISDYADRLATDVFQGPELHEVGTTLSSALFASHDVGSEARLRAESLVASTLAAHPPERRTRSGARR